MFNFINGGNNSDNNENNSTSDSKPVEETLDKEEIRRRRLAKVSSSSTASGNDGDTNKLSSNTSTLTISNEIASTTTSDEHKAKISKMNDSPIKPKNGPIAVASSISSPLKGDREAIVLNLLLEFISKSTLRTEGADHDCYYVGANLKNSGELITVSNFQEIICARLENKSSIFSAISYLLSCYKRVLSREGSTTGSAQEALNSCKSQIVSFVGSCLGLPDMFETAANSIHDFIVAIAEDASSSVNTFVKDVIEDLEKQEYLEDVVTKFAEKIYEMLNPVAINPSTGRQAAMRSLLDNYSTPLTALNVLLRDKRATKLIVNYSNFQPNPQDLDQKAPARDIPPMLLHNPMFIEAHGKQGAAIEHRTLLGRLLRIAPDFQDPKIFEMFKDVTRQSRTVVDGKVNDLRARAQQAITVTTEVILALLKSGGASKEQALHWMKVATLANEEAEKDRPSPLIAASEGFMTNFGAVMLNLARPVFEDHEKLKKVDFNYLLSREGQEIFKADLTKLMLKSSLATSLSADIESSLANHSAQSTTYSFITQSFLFCWRALHLGVVSRCNKYVQILRILNHHAPGLQTGDMKALQYLVMKLTTDAQLLSPTLLKDMLNFLVGAAKLFMTKLQSPEKYLAHTVHRTSWLVSAEEHSLEELTFLTTLPEHLLDDLVSMLLFIAKSAPATLLEANLEPMLSLLLFFLRRPFAIQSPHLRAKLGNALYQVFLPVQARGEHEMYTHLKSVDGAHTALLASHLDAEKFLAPALLLLYGDVERTGFYEKLSNRRAIMIVLKHLWTLPSHRAAFRGIATSTNDSHDNNNNNNNNSFIRFANGLLNETNSLVATTIDKLSEIRKTQLLMQNHAEYSKLSEEERKHLEERHESNEMECKGSAVLCLETLNMLNYLTSDAVIRRPFLSAEILPRFTSTLLNVLQRIVGSKSLEIKVENMDQYNFDPKTMLFEVVTAMTHFFEEEQFARSVAQDSFYHDGAPLRKAIQTAARLNLLAATELAALSQLAQRASAVRSSLEDIEALVEDAPFEYLDPLLSTLMRDPVLLPTSNTVIDRTTIAQHLLNNEIDPFNRKPLTIDMIQPLPELKAQIDDWIKSKKANQGK